MYPRCNELSGISDCMMAVEGLSRPNELHASIDGRLELHTGPDLPQRRSHLNTESMGSHRMIGSYIDKDREL